VNLIFIGKLITTVDQACINSGIKKTGRWNNHSAYNPRRSPVKLSICTLPKQTAEKMLPEMLLENMEIVPAVFNG
jgi:hypothetical protein